jgi:hypothetical protein
LWDGQHMPEEAKSEALSAVDMFYKFEATDDAECWGASPVDRLSRKWTIWLPSRIS